MKSTFRRTPLAPQAGSFPIALEAGSIERKIDQVNAYMSHTEDLMIRRIETNDQSYALLYLEGLVDKDFMQAAIIQPLQESIELAPGQVVSSASIAKSSDVVRIGRALLEGYCVAVTENDSEAVMMSAGKKEGRSVEEPRSEQIIKGSHEGFNECLSTNIYLLRKRIKSPKFKLGYYTLGSVTNTKVAIIYMDDLADPKIVEECLKRISSIQLDYLYSAGNIDEWLEEHPFSPFPQTIQSERPDRVVSYLMEGKIAIAVDGSPNVLVLPITFFSFYQSPDDYNSRWIIGSFYRIIRLVSFILATCLPAFYIAIVSYHSEVLPIGILYSVKVSLTYVPLPPILEALLMQTILELLKEAAIRLPSPIAQTIGIVGGLVIGTAVVEAQLVSHTMIVVIGLTAIASFATPLNEFGTSLRILGFPMMLAAALFGFFGISIMLMAIFIHLCKIETLGVPYFTPFGPFKGKENAKDMYLRLPRWMDDKEPQSGKSNPLKPLFSGRWKRS
ncbi:spore germination protein [Paenibacillus arenilitoris]|uniref:Spore germination protein n=1 Tax=Paenibacillus arenilitoris TaxID=2772299 RepID=A0A927CKZ0_9BACL|nr:spore germination protein [Paenibacillus arenilitoris]MBD2869998.1 spore germination protein [Paenibacillus arenilitoris]